MTVRWCPGHKGVEGNEMVNQLANKAAITDLPKSHIDNTNLAVFKAAIRDWVQQTQKLSPTARKLLGHDTMKAAHLKAISKLKKHAVATISQMRSGHIPLSSHISTVYHSDPTQNALAPWARRQLNIICYYAHSTLNIDKPYKTS